jgi:hypothetical protein
MRCLLPAARLALGASRGDAVRSYMRLIHNAGNVPGSTTVGHGPSPNGGNVDAFGNDLANNGYTWAGVCRLTACQPASLPACQDCDGDGRSHGQELNDPDCVWSQGQASPPSTGITNPGVRNVISASPTTASPTSKAPSNAPSQQPTKEPSIALPTAKPTTRSPITKGPTDSSGTVQPSSSPTLFPTAKPSAAPNTRPTSHPS